jgi:hypothetical protein
MLPTHASYTNSSYNSSHKGYHLCTWRWCHPTTQYLQLHFHSHTWTSQRATFNGNTSTLHLHLQRCCLEVTTLNDGITVTRPLPLPLPNLTVAHILYIFIYHYTQCYIQNGGSFLIIYIDQSLLPHKIWLKRDTLPIARDPTSSTAIQTDPQHWCLFLFKGKPYLWLAKPWLATDKPISYLG